jgi:hypothetical protein
VEIIWATDLKEYPSHMTVNIIKCTCHGANSMGGCVPFYKHQWTIVKHTNQEILLKDILNNKEFLIKMID